LLISGSGGTKSLMNYASKAKEINATVALVTTNKDSAIGNESDYRLRIPAATKKRLPAETDTIQQLGSTIDQSAHLLLDEHCVCLLDTYQGDRSEDSLNIKHTNLE